MAEMPSKPRRRFLRFSLRSLLIAVTVAGIAVGWVAWNVNVVHHRQRLRESCDEQWSATTTRQDALEALTALRTAAAPEGELARFEDMPDVSLIRRLLGDEAIALFEFADPPPVDMKAEMRNWFPESLFDYRAPGVSGESRTYEEDAMSGRISFPTIGTGRRTGPEP